MSGKVVLVGAGPGDEGLITVKGQHLLTLADVIVYDQLVNPRFLTYAKEGCQFIYVGKKAGHHTMIQEDINALLVRLAKEQDLVVRLKGGDPYVFGRGSEEGMMLHEAGIEFEVVPGISSAIGGLTYAGIPITARNLATSFHVITGHTSSQNDEMGYETLAKLKGTLVFLMGVANLENIVNGLLEGGLSLATPVGIIYKATTPEQVVTVGTLETIVELAVAQQVQSPALIVVGEVVGLRNPLNFFEKQSLFGRQILVTRSRTASSKLVKALLNQGAMVHEVPVIKTVPLRDNELDESIQNLEGSEVIIFTSGETVKRFMGRLRSLELDLRHLGQCQVIAIGSETEKVMDQYGLFADYVPDHFSLEGINDVLMEHIEEGKKLVIPRSAKADWTWIVDLQKRYEVEEIICYDTVMAQLNPELKRIIHSLDYITFTSSSTVHGFVHQLQEQDLTLSPSTKIVAIGPSTAATLKSYNIEVHLQPDRYTVMDMVGCILQDQKS